MKLIRFIKTYQVEIVLALAIILISITSFNLGKISALKHSKTTIKVTEPASSSQTASSADKIKIENTNKADVSVVASKASKSRLYHFPWCQGASKIADKNKITFATETAAISAGYTLAGNCQR